MIFFAVLEAGLVSEAVQFKKSSARQLGLAMDFASTKYIFTGMAALEVPYLHSFRFAILGL